jgi:serine/threonine-protein kinase
VRLEAGESIDGRYRLIGRLGSGGMADVWCAEDSELGRRVALKFLHERFAQDREFVERFRREAAAAAGLQHPNVVGVYDRGEHDGSHYIAMEYVEGASLKELISQGLTVPEAVEITRQVLAGARFAHAHGIVHRDLKPQNVLVNSQGRALVTDFGIARAGASEITQTGSVLGTAHYLSPEQAQGLPVTPASDLYSIGVILYEALTGRVPFEGDSAVSVALKQVSEQPRPPSELNPEISRALDAVVLRALAKDPANRFASAEEFLGALDAAEADPGGGALGDTAAYAAVPAPAPPPPVFAPPPRRFWTRGRVALLALLALLLAGVAAFALTRTDRVLVPSVIEDEASAATRVLEGKGFEVDALPRPSCAPANTVTEQDPPAGSRADEGSTVVITVSTGLSVKIPSVQDLSRADAVKRLDREQLLVKTEETFDDSNPGSVIGTEPRAGTDVDCDSKVTLLVSKGPNVVMLPSVVGSQQDVAEATLENLGLIVNVETRDADEPQGQVIEQVPAAGSELRKGTTVTIIVSTGAGSVEVPDVLGRPESTAVDLLEARGLRVEVVEQDTERAAEDGRVLDQAPDAGTRLREGDSVTIFVGALVPPEPPDFDPTPGGKR